MKQILTDHQMSDYGKMVLEQTKQAKIKARMEKSIAGHTYQLERLRFRHRIIEALTWTSLCFGFVLCLAALIVPFV